MFLVGCVLMFPAFALYTPALAGDPDSARLLASILHVQQNGVDYLVETQEVLLPHLVMGPVLALGGIPGSRSSTRSRSRSSAGSSPSSPGVSPALRWRSWAASSR